MKDTFWGIQCVWLRYFDVYRKDLLYALTVTFVDPILYLVSFGYGMGGIIGNVEYAGVSLQYRQFVFAGIVAQTMLFQGFFESAYGSFIRMYYQKIFKAMATTPITLSEVLWAELLWDASKATFASTIVLLIGTLTGDFAPLGSLLCVPFCFVCAFMFSGFGMWMAAISKSIEQINYPNYLFIFPMFLFCGVFFPLDKMPDLIQKIAWCLPLTQVLAVVRHLTLGTRFDALGLLVLVGWTALFVFMARTRMIKRVIH